LRDEPVNAAVVEQENTEREHQIVQECVIRGEDYADLPGGDDAEANQAEPAG
jgi:hypothetical protein